MKTIVLIPLLIILVSCQQAKKNKAFFTFMTRGNFVFSLHPKAYNNLLNYFILEHSLATLFRGTGDGIARPFLVESWVSDEAGLTWTFKLKKGFYDDNQQELTPSYWCEGIKRIIPMVSSPEDIVLLSGLIDWKKYIDGKAPFPIICDNISNSLTFKFSEPPGGIKDYLAMPIFGFWPDNILNNSTGTYKLINFTDEKVELKLRIKDPEIEITDATIRLVNEAHLNSYTIVSNEVVWPAKKKVDGNFFPLKLTPTSVEFIEINKFSANFKSNEDIALSIAQRIFDFKNTNPIQDSNALPTKAIYYDIQGGHNFLHPINSKKIAEIRLLTRGPTKELIPPYYSTLIHEAISPHADKIAYIFHSNDRDRNQQIHNRDYDIRLGVVEAGTYPDQWVTEMMFCTKQGVSFIDPKNKVCSLLKDSTRISAESLGQKINEITRREGTLIPLFNWSTPIYVGQDFHESSFSPNSYLPRIDSIKFK